MDQYYYMSLTSKITSWCLFHITQQISEAEVKWSNKIKRGHEYFWTAETAIHNIFLEV